MPDRSDWPKQIEMAGSILVVEATNEERLSAPTIGGSRRVAYSAIGESCELCQSLDGKIFLADSDLARRYNPPLHPNCQCLWVEVGDDEPWAEADQDYMTTDYEAELAERELLDRGLWIGAPPGEGPYEVLRVPAAPSGRDFTFRRELDPVTGEMQSRLTWHRERYELPGLDPKTVIDGVKDVGERWRPLGSGGDVPPVPPGPGPGPAGPGSGSAGPGWRSSHNDEKPRLLRKAAPSGRQRLDESPDFAAATSVEEVEELLRERLPEHVVVDLSGIDVQHARTIGAELAAHAEEWPEAAQMLQRVGTHYNSASGDYAVTDQNGASIEFNTLWWDQYPPLRRLTEEAEENGRVPAGTGNVAGIACEEWGHQIKNWIDRTLYGVELDRWLDEHGLPSELYTLGEDDMDTIERERQEMFGRGFRILAMTPDSSHPWVVGLRAELERIVGLIREPS